VSQLISDDFYVKHIRAYFLGELPNSIYFIFRGTIWEKNLNGIFMKNGVLFSWILSSNYLLGGDNDPIWIRLCGNPEYGSIFPTSVCVSNYPIGYIRGNGIDTGKRF